LSVKHSVTCGILMDPSTKGDLVPEILPDSVVRFRGRDVGRNLGFVKG